MQVSDVRNATECHPSQKRSSVDQPPALLDDPLHRRSHLLKERGSVVHHGAPKYHTHVGIVMIELVNGQCLFVGRASDDENYHILGPGGSIRKSLPPLNEQQALSS